VIDDTLPLSKSAFRELSPNRRGEALDGYMKAMRRGRRTETSAAIDAQQFPTSTESTNPLVPEKPTVSGSIVREYIRKNPTDPQVLEAFKENPTTAVGTKSGINPHAPKDSFDENTKVPKSRGTRISYLPPQLKLNAFNQYARDRITSNTRDLDGEVYEKGYKGGVTGSAIRDFFHKNPNDTQVIQALRNNPDTNIGKRKQK